MKNNYTPGDEFDGFVRSFFQNELPRNFVVPEVKEPTRTTVVPGIVSPHRSGLKARLALVLSIALLVFGSFVLSNRFSRESTPNGIRSIGPDKASTEDSIRSPFRDSNGSREFRMHERLLQRKDGPTELNFTFEPVDGNE